jgi:quercetin dioxygenase-like cupin family protein
MLQVGATFEDPKTGATLEIVRLPEGGSRALEIRRQIKPGNGKTLAHFHLDYLERFAVEEGEATAKLDDETRVLRSGDEMEVPIDRPHVNAYNDSGDDLVLRHTFDPVSDFALAYVETLGHYMRKARADRSGEVPVPAVFAIARATSTATYATGLPRVVQDRILFPIGVGVAKLLRYELYLPNRSA